MKRLMLNALPGIALLGFTLIPSAAVAENPNCPALIGPFDVKTAACGEGWYEVINPDGEQRVEFFVDADATTFSGYQDGLAIFPEDEAPPSVRAPFMALSGIRPSYDARGRIRSFEVAHRSALKATPRDAQRVSMKAYNQSKVSFRAYLVQGDAPEVPLSIRQQHDFRLSTPLTDTTTATLGGSSSVSLDREEDRNLQQLYLTFGDGRLDASDLPSIRTTPPDNGDYRRVVGRTDSTYEYTMDIEGDLMIVPGDNYILRGFSQHQFGQQEMQLPDLISIWQTESVEGYRVTVASPNPQVRFELQGVENTPPFLINAGLNDAWYNPATSGQGMLIIVFPERQEVFLAWFTYDTERPSGNVRANIGDPGHRWLTAQGPYDGDTAILQVYETKGGVFDAEQPRPATGAPVGSIEITWLDCETAILSYRIDTTENSGMIELRRITRDNVAMCEALASE